MTEQERKLGVALWAALDVVNEHLGGFANWPEPLKEAFADALIDSSPPSEDDIAWARELCERFGWEKSSND